jgi:hypothetical protein
VYDVPFLTTGATCQAVPPAGNGMSCDGEYYGVQQFRTNFDESHYEFKAPIHVERQNTAGGTIGTWSVADGNTSTALGNMRHFSAREGGRYVLTFPSRNPLTPTVNEVPTWVELTVNNMNNELRPDGNFIMAVSFSGSLTATGYITSWPSADAPRTWGPSEGVGYVRRFTPALDWATFLADTTGNLIWQDRGNNRVWVRPRGGLPYFGAYDAPLSDRDVYRPSRLMLYAAP